MFVTGLTHSAIYIAVGIISGFLSGLLGIGGGTITVPALLFIFNSYQDVPSSLSMVIAAGTSLAIMAFTSHSAIRAHARASEIQWPLFFDLLPGLFLGTIAGVFSAHLLASHYLKIFLGVFLILMGLKILLTRSQQPISKRPNKILNFFLSFFIGFIPGLLGIGAGLLIITYLTYCGIEIHRIVAISAISTFLVALIGTFFFMLLGFGTPGLPLYSTGYVYWPAVILISIPSVASAGYGARLSYRIQPGPLRMVFAMVLLLVGFNLVY